MTEVQTPGPDRPAARAAKTPAASARAASAPASVPASAAAMFGDALPSAQRYADMLTSTGVQRGIVGPGESDRIWDRHLLNCGAIARLMPANAFVVDLGSGAGLPGMVLAMLLPGARVTLLEPMARRVEFLSECAAALELANVTVLRGRAEDLAGQLSADVVTARAVAPLDRLAGLMLGLLRPGGRGLAIKGESAAAELARARPVLARLGISDAKVVHAGSSPGRNLTADGAESESVAPEYAVAGNGAAGPAAGGTWATVVTFTAPDRRTAAAAGSRAGAHGPAAAGSIPGRMSGRRGSAGGRRSRPNSRRGGG